MSAPYSFAKPRPVDLSSLSGARLGGWCSATLLPFWLSASWDRQHGGFHERLDSNGKAVKLNYKRIRLQCRQIYVWSHSHLLGLSDQGAAAAHDGMSFMLRSGWNADSGGWNFKVSSDGRSVIDDARQLYCQAFALYGLGWHHKATGDPESVVLAKKTLAFMDSTMADADVGGYWDIWTPRGMPLPRHQNPHMHLLEALLVLAEATEQEEFLDRARAVVKLFRTRFCPSPHERVSEYFDAGWTRLAGEDGDRFEPGHHYEWIWILHQYAKLSGDRSIYGVVEPLLSYTRANGTDRQEPRATFDELNELGAATLTSKRLWPQTETVKALLAAYEWSGEERWRTAAEQHLDLIFEVYLRGGQPLFREHIDRTGNTDLVAFVPTSSLYHLFLAITEAIRLLPRGPTGQPA